MLPIKSKIKVNYITFHTVISLLTDKTHLFVRLLCCASITHLIFIPPVFLSSVSDNLMDNEPDAASSLFLLETRHVAPSTRHPLAMFLPSASSLRSSLTLFHPLKSSLHLPSNARRAKLFSSRWSEEVASTNLSNY